MNSTEDAFQTPPPRRDIFQKKLERGVPLTVWDKEYTGGADYHSAIDHVKARLHHS